jgi:hypothetical protein
MPEGKDTAPHRGLVLGDRVRDIQTGMEGKAVGRCSWWFGPDTVGIQKHGVQDNGKLYPVIWVERSRVVITQDRDTMES